MFTNERYVSHQVAKYDGREVAGHHFELEMISCSVVPEPPTGIVSRANLKFIVSKLMGCEMIKFPSIFPNALKKKLLFNMLLVMMTTLTVFLGASECDILGHRIAAAFTHLQGTSMTSVLKVPPGTSRINAQNVNDFVEGLLRGDKTWLPQSIERAVITSVSVIVLTIFEEVFVDFRVNLIGATVRFHLVPGAKHLRMLPIEAYKSNIPVIKSGNVRKLPSSVLAQCKEMTRDQYIEALKIKKQRILKQVKDIDLLLDLQTQRYRQSIKKGVVDALTIASSYLHSHTDTKKSLIKDNETSPVSVLSPTSQGRMTGAYETSKHKMSKLLKSTKIVIPHSMKKQFGFSKSTKDDETKDQYPLENRKKYKESEAKINYGMFE